MSADKIQKINKKAASIRAAAREEVKPEPPPKIIRRTEGESSFRVWWQIQHFPWRYSSYRFGKKSSYSVSVIWGTVIPALLLIPGVFIAALVDSAEFRSAIWQWIQSAPVLFSALLFLPLLALVIWPIVSFLRYKKWKEKLGFSLTGWDILTENAVFTKWMWRDCSVRIVLWAAAPVECREALENSLTIFIDRANRWYYDFEDTDTVRPAWKKSGPFSVSGSANSRVAGEIKELAQDYVFEIHRRWNCVVKMEIQAGEEKLVVEYTPGD